VQPVRLAHRSLLGCSVVRVIRETFRTRTVRTTRTTRTIRTIYGAVANPCAGFGDRDSGTWRYGKPGRKSASPGSELRAPLGAYPTVALMKAPSVYGSWPAGA